MARDTQSRKFQLTFNNPQEKGLTQTVLKETTENSFKSIVYYCMSDEVGGNENTYHTHIYLHLKSPTRFSRVKKVYPSAHIEACKGTAQQNRDYVFKIGKWQSTTTAETNLPETHYEFGELPEEKKGKRTDLAELYEDIKSGMTNAEIIEANPQHLERLTHIDRVRKTVFEEQYKKTWRNLTVTYIYRATGTGKTRSIMEHHGYENCYRVTDYKHPFDSYNQLNVITFDEFDSKIPIRAMLNYLDGYPLELPARYVNRVACFSKIFLISNKPITSLYKDEQQDEVEVWHAFLRRIHSVIEMTSRDFCIPHHLKFNSDRLLILQNPLKDSYTFDHLANDLEFKTGFNTPLLKISS